MKTKQNYLSQRAQRTQSLIFIFLCGLCVLGGEQFKLCFADEPLANANLEGLYAKSIEQVLRLSPEQIDTGTAALIVSEAWSDMVAGRRYQQQLDDIATEIRSRLKAKDTPMGAAAIPVINDYLFNELKFKAINKATDPYDLFLHSVMDRRQGYCLSLSVLYLAVGERLGLPLYGVVVPGHFFVRYDDGHVRFNIETTAKGSSAADDYYIREFNVPQNNTTIYMANLNKRQTLGCFFNNLGNVYGAINNVDQAIASLQWAVYINPSLAESRINLGNNYMLKNRVDDAITEYQAAVKINPDNAKAHSNLANAYQKREWFNDAINEYTAAIKLDRSMAETYLGMGLCYNKLNQPDSEIDAYLKALAINPNMFEALANLGGVYFNKGDYDAAIEQYNKAARVNPANAGLYYQLGAAYSNKGDYENTVKACLKAVELDPKMADAHYGLAFAYYKLKNYDLAMEHIKTAEKLGKTIDQNLLKAIENKI
ncbi:MAG: tetratricopeptide repeat protein [Sedimentisphaerales bacterium]|jgi:tetratricopeptide (TPR) repeat protein